MGSIKTIIDLILNKERYRVYGNEARWMKIDWIEKDDSFLDYYGQIWFVLRDKNGDCITEISINTLHEIELKKLK